MQINIERISMDIPRASSLVDCHHAVTDIAQMILRNKVTGKEEKRDVIIFNMNAARKIMPSSAGIQDLPFQKNPVTELTVAVAEPICYELGKETWWKSLVPLTLLQLKKQFVQVVESPP